MKIQLKLYASLACHMPEKTDGNLLTVDVREGTSVKEFLENMKVPADGIKIVFVNGIHATGDEILNEGDRVGVFPPVAGG